jgi:hypothetical protein
MLEGRFDVMINYGAKVRSIPKNANLVFLDSGGFCFFTKNFDYNDSLERYLEYARKKGVDLFANRDYPCEPELLRLKRTTVRENQMKTIDNHVKIMDLLEGNFFDLKDRFVGVIQGWTVEDYLWMADYLKEHGLLTDFVAIGSVCRRNKEKDVRDVILAVRDALPKRIKLHAFGVKFSVLKYKEVWDSLWSCDSVAYRYEVRKSYVENKPIKVQIKDKLDVWIKKLQNLQMRHGYQQTLDNYVVIA